MVAVFFFVEQEEKSKAVKHSIVSKKGRIWCLLFMYLGYLLYDNDRFSVLLLRYKDSGNN